jgi:hypothetical protein
VVTERAAFTVMLRAFVVVLLAESVTCTVKLEVVAGPVGVPVIAPVAALRFKPAGKVPTVIAQFVYGVTPPAAASVVDTPDGYGELMAPVGSEDVITLRAAFTRTLSAFVAL